MKPMKRKLLTINEAATKYEIDPEKLRDLPTYEREGEILVLAEDVAEVKAVLIPKSRFTHLEGCEISISEASRRYNLATSTLSKWAKRGHIRILRRTGKEVYLNESDVAYAHAIYLVKGTTKGKSLFPKN